MSLRNLASRRPSTAHATSDKTSFLAPENEVLLWAKQLQRQHGELLLRLNKLQDEHETFDSRIQATESIAKTITSETFKIDDIDRKVSALVAGDQEFEDWAGGAIKKLERNVEANSKLQHAVNGLEARCVGMRNEIEKLTYNQQFAVSEVEELKVSLRELQQRSTGEARSNSAEVKGMLKRIEVLESQLKRDDTEMGGLKEGLANVQRICRQQDSINSKFSIAVLRQQEAIQYKSGSAVSEATTTSEPAPLKVENIQVPRTPQREPRFVLDDQPLNPIPPQGKQNARQKVSARMRLMQHPSVLDEKEPKSHIARKIPTSNSRSDLRDREDSIQPVPGMQMSRPSPSKQRRIGDNQTQRQTRSQAKTVAAEEMPKRSDLTGSQISPTQQIPVQKVNENQGLPSPLLSVQKKQVSRVRTTKTRGNNTVGKVSNNRSPKKPASVNGKQSVAISSAVTSTNVPQKRKRNHPRRVIPDYPGL